MENEKSASPLPTKKEAEKIEGMSFFKALELLAGGKKIHKLEWKDKEFYGQLKDTLVKLHKPTGNYHDWIISEGDMVGNDWVVIE